MSFPTSGIYPSECFQDDDADSRARIYDADFIRPRKREGLL